MNVIGGPPGDPCTLSIEHVQLNMEGSLHVQEAEVLRALDEIASPLSWEWGSAFIGLDVPPDTPHVRAWQA